MKLISLRSSAMAVGLSLMACWSLSSCGDNNGPGSDAPDEASGTVTLDLQLDPLPVGSEVEPARSTSSKLLVTLKDLILTLTDKDRKKVTTHSVDDFSESKEILTGSYKIEASFGTKGEEGWGKLFCYGLQEFRVRLGKTTEISMPVTMSNSMVEVNYSDAFNEYLTDVTTSVITEAGNTFDWDGDKTEDLYISPGTFNVSVSFTKPNGKSATAVVGPYTAEAKHQYAVNLDVDYASTEQIVLTIDDTVTEKEETVDISDENLPALMAAPEITLSEGYTLRQTIEMVEYDKVTTPLVATVMARGRIASAVLVADSRDLQQSTDFPGSVDLCNPGNDAQTLADMGLDYRGFAGSGSVFGQIDFTRLLSNIPYNDDNGSSKSEFRLTVTDTHGNEVTKRLFTVNLTQLSLIIPAQGQIVAEGSATINVECNATSPVFEVTGKSPITGAQIPLTVGTPTKIGTNSANGNTIYTLPLSSDIITYDQEVKVTVYVADKRVETESVIHVPSTRIEAEKTNAFAKNALVSVVLTTDEAAQEADKVSFEVSTDGTNFTAATSELVTAPDKQTAGHAAVYKITGLNPLTNYTIRSIHKGEKCHVPATFTTEAADQLPNAGMDTWDKKEKAKYQWLWKPESWATQNELTTSEVNNYSYQATSGTIPANGRSTKSGASGTSSQSDGHTDGNANLHTDKAHTGNNAALIRTVAWGKHNNACSMFNPGNFGTEVNNMTPGELKLEDYTFGSRPSALSFYYHYDVVKAGNGDFGTVEIEVLDQDGQTIASGNANITEPESDKLGQYQEMRLNLKYDIHSQKASKISIKFVSSVNPAALKKDKDFWNLPGYNNLSGGEYVGSELYVDDITLIY